jgi:Tfp pilus assembly protein PilO
MDKQNIVKKLLKQIDSKKAKDYTYATLFFFVFSIFVFFAIRPSLVTAFSLKSQEGQLSQLNTNYESVISKIVSIQSSFETYRDDLHLFSEAVPLTPNMNKLIRDVEEATATNSVTIDKFSAGEVNLVDKSRGKLRSTIFSIEASSSFENLLKSLEDIYNQRRLKKIIRFVIKRKDLEASGSAGLKFQLDIEGYYL